MRADLTYLSSPELEGRGITTAGVVKASEFIRKEFKRLGLKSGVPDGSYYQPFKYGDRRLINREQTHLTIGSKTLEAGKDFSPMASGESAPFKGPLVFAGYGITTENGTY